MTDKIRMCADRFLANRQLTANAASANHPIPLRLADGRPFNVQVNLRAHGQFGNEQQSWIA